jgi:hypothetical protein
MAEAKKNPKACVTGKVRASYVNVFKPRLNSESGKMEYGMELLISKKDTVTMDRLKAIAFAAIDEKFKEKPSVAKIFKQGWNKLIETGKHQIDSDENIYMPLRDGDTDRSEDENGEKVLTKTLRPEVAGCYLVRCKAYEDSKPGIVDANRDDVIDATAFASGDYCRAALASYAFETKGNRGVSFWLNGVQVVEKGEPLGSGPRDAKQMFDEFEEEDWN